MRNLTLPLDLIKKMVDWGRKHRDVASILFVEGDNHYVMDRSEEYALFMHKHLLDPWLLLLHFVTFCSMFGTCQQHILVLTLELCQSFSELVWILKIRSD